MPQLAQRFLNDTDALNANLRAKYDGFDLSSSPSSISSHLSGGSAREATDIGLLRAQLVEFYDRHCPEAVPRAGQVALTYSDDIRYVLREWWAEGRCPRGGIVAAC